VSGYVTFVVENREMAGPLLQVQEVVRAVGIEPMIGARAPVTGLLVLRGLPMPVVDLRSGAEFGDAGDVLVLAPDGAGAVGLAVDRVLAVLGPDDLTPLGAEERRLAGLPPYVEEVRRDAGGRPVLVVTLRRLAGLVPA
jgi:chemotaxis signal transduction protein